MKPQSSLGLFQPCFVFASAHRRMLVTVAVRVRRSEVRKTPMAWRGSFAVRPGTCPSVLFLFSNAIEPGVLHV